MSSIGQGKISVDIYSGLKFKGTITCSITEVKKTEEEKTKYLSKPDKIGFDQKLFGQKHWEKLDVGETTFGVPGFINVKLNKKNEKNENKMYIEDI